MKLRTIHLRETLEYADLVTYKEIKNGTVKEYYVFTRSELEEFYHRSVMGVTFENRVMSAKDFDEFMKEQGD